MAIDGTQATADRLPARVIEDLLGAEQRRLLLACLATQGGRMVLDDLAAHVRAREIDVDPAAVEPEQRRAVREEIFQRHLPKLTATGVVEYDSMLDAVTLEEPGLAERARAKR